MMEATDKLVMTQGMMKNQFAKLPSFKLHSAFSQVAVERPKKIGVVMVPMFCKYNSGFRSIDYKSKVRLGKQKKRYKRMSQSGMVCLQKYNNGFWF